MNSVTIAGNIARDAEVKYTPKGDAVANFSVADNQGKDKPAIFWNMSLYGGRAESLAPYLTKGQAVAISGVVSEREWTDKEGNKRKSMDVRVNDVALQGGKREQDSQPAQRQPARQQKAAAFDDTDVPF